MSSNCQVTFPNFREALNFCDWIGCGVVTRNDTEYEFVWRSEGPHLSRAQQSKYDAYMGVDSVWQDDASGLTWMYSPAYERLRYRTQAGGEGPNFAGFSDWRPPTLTELKTLRSSTQDENGLWRTPALAGKIGPVLRSITNGYWDPDERRDWDFSRDSACEDEHRDSKIAWGSEGQFAGFEGGSSRSTGAKSILVRGTDSTLRPLWFEEQVRWAEEHRVDDFPVTLQTIERLAALSLSVDKFPPQLDRLTKLQSLSVRNTATLVPEVFALPALQSLTWKIERHVPAAKQTVCLPSAIGTLKHLKTLSIDGPIELVPDSMCELDDLEELDLGWAFTGLPAELGRLCKLRTLRLRAGSMESLPASIGQLSALTELSIHAKSLSSLPEQLGHLLSLERLDLSSCCLQQLPGSFKELVDLTSLDLSLNPLPMVPPELGALKRLKWLNLCGAPLKEVPPAVRELTNLESLNLSGTQIEALPEWLWEMKSLRRLTIAKTWKLPRLANPNHPTIKVEYYSGVLDQPWGRDWLRKMGKPD